MPDLARMCSASAATLRCARDPLVAVKNISKSYGRTTAVAGVTLSLWAGEIWGFVGANGAGKATTLRMLAGILRPDGGAGHVLGFDLQRDAARIRERVGYMSQRLSLYAELSVFENLRFHAEVYGLKNPRAEIEAIIREFGLVPWTHSPAGSLSGGWARRLQLAASLRPERWIAAKSCRNSGNPTLQLGVSDPPSATVRAGARPRPIWP